MKNWHTWPSVVTYSLVEFYFKWQKHLRAIYESLLFRWVNSTLVTTKYSYLSARKKIYAYFETAFLKAPEATFVPLNYNLQPNFLRGEKREVHLVQWPKEVNHFNKYFQFHQTAQGTFKEHLKKTWWTNIPTFSTHDCKPFQLSQQRRNARASDLKRSVYNTNKSLSNSPTPGELNQTSNNSVHKRK